MKKKLSSVIIFLALTFTAIAQSTYDYEIRQDVSNQYIFTLNAVSSNVVSNTDYADSTFMIIVDAGIPVNLGSASVGVWEVSGFLDADLLTQLGVGDGSKDFYSFASSTGTIALSGSDIEIVEFSVGGSPSSGSISLLSNDDPIAVDLGNAGIQAENVMNVDYNDGNGAKNSYGQNIGTTSYSFVDQTLSNNSFKKSSSFSVTPNPNNGEFTIRGAQTLGNTTITVYNIAGHQVYRATKNSFGKNTLEMNLSERLATGAYLIKMANANNSVMIKMIVN